MPRLIGGPEKAHDADVTIAAHAMHVRTTMLSLASNRKFLRFTQYIYKMQTTPNKVIINKL